MCIRDRDWADEIEDNESGNITMDCLFILERSHREGYAYLGIYYRGEQIGAQQVRIGDWGMIDGYKITPREALLKIEKIRGGVAIRH